MNTLIDNILSTISKLTNTKRGYAGVLAILILILLVTIINWSGDNGDYIYNDNIEILFPNVRSNNKVVDIKFRYNPQSSEMYSYGYGFISCKRGSGVNVECTDRTSYTTTNFYFKFKDNGVATLQAETKYSNDKDLGISATGRWKAI